MAKINRSYAVASNWKTRESSECPKDMPKKNSGFANFSSSDQWCFVHDLSTGKMPCSTGESSNWKVRFARFRNSGHTKNNWPNHEINGNSGSPKLLIQANNGQKSKLVSFGVRSIRSGLLAESFMEINVYSISIYKSIYFTLNWSSDTCGIVSI